MTIGVENLDKNFNPPNPHYFESTLNEIKLHKTNKTKPIESCCLQGNLWLLELRKYNRNIQIRNKKVKDLTCEYKLKVDQKFLTLQNLLYQVKYLKQEIKKCYDYQTQYDDIYWIPLQQFLKIKPEFANNAEDLGIEEDCDDVNGIKIQLNLSEDAKIDNEHCLMIARMEWELEQRKSLNLKYTEMLKKKLLIESDIRDKRKLLASIYPTLTNALKASQPLQKLFKLNFEKDYKYTDLIYTIPLPLYLIYTKWQAYINLFDDNSVDLEIIEGDEVKMEEITSNMVSNLEKIIKVSREQSLQKSDAHHNIDDIMSEEILLNYEDDYTIHNKSRTALSTNDQRYGDFNEVYGTILDCDLQHCLTPSKYFIKVTLKMDAQRFRALKGVSADDIWLNEQILSTELSIYFYPKLNVLTIEAKVVGEIADMPSNQQSKDIGLKAWNSLKQKLLLNLDLNGHGNRQFGVFEESSTLSSSYHSPKIIKALMGIENMGQDLETSHCRTLDHCLNLVFDQIGHPFFWLENLGGLVNTTEPTANTTPTLREYYSLHVIKRVVDSLTQRLASRLHIRHLVSSIGKFFSDPSNNQIKERRLLPQILEISWTDSKLDEGHYSLGTLDVSTYVPPQNLGGPPEAFGLKVTISLTLPINCACLHAGQFGGEQRAKAATAAPTIAFRAHEIVAKGDGGAGGDQRGSRQKLADLKVKARLYEEFKELEKKINLGGKNNALERLDNQPCAFAYMLGHGLRGVTEMAKLLNESRTHLTEPLTIGLLTNLDTLTLKQVPMGGEDKGMGVDMKAIFFA